VLWEVELGGHYRGNCRRHLYGTAHRKFVTGKFPFTSYIAFIVRRPVDLR
jgi:hypothetical protein